MQPVEIEQLVIDTWNFADPAASEDAFRARLAEVAPASPEAAVFMTQVARTNGLRGDFATAHETLDAAAAVTNAIAEGPERDHAEARIAIERGRALNSSGAPADALPYFETSLELAARAGAEGLAVDALHMQAIVLGQTSGPEAAAEVNLRAIELAQNSSDPAARRWLGSLLNNLGWDRHGAGEYEEALGLFEQALVVRIEQGSTPEITVARWAVARALRSLGRLEDALAIQQSLADDPANADDGYIPEEIAECLLELGRVDEAKTHFSRANVLLSQDPWLVEHEPERLARLAEYTSAESDPLPRRGGRNGPV